MPNAALAYQVLDLINKHRDHFSMDTWVSAADGAGVGLDELTSEAHCGTTACFAGWTVALAGASIGAGSCVVFDSAGNAIEGTVGSHAAKLLDIEEPDRGDLFLCENDEIEHYVEKIFGPRPE